MFPEAEVLSELDLLDSRLYAMFAALDGLQPGAFSERIWSLDNRIAVQAALTARARRKSGQRRPPRTRRGGRHATTAPCGRGA